MGRRRPLCHKVLVVIPKPFTRRPNTYPSSRPTTVIPAKAGISGGGARKEPHEIPTFVGMTTWGGPAKKQLLDSRAASA